ncbi:RHS repeat-associated core domain-containing protein [Streptacidiphilus sp. PB12-B1b]|uniref:RHS repeat-associated core domain-containing protein n=1 Tax=Streptacidiphilus sp. PB12-B1b TaxID=2705012 RepID=UPI0015FA17FC|nr:RHS repeat-associated core domain-containing protein [Streptacidiphilus sp. PB12-B1b]QMU80516.1 RHS repeat-associated core domain-containing protein [Streptacidiphilus sp. PB12-B1b]
MTARGPDQPGYCKGVENRVDSRPAGTLRGTPTVTVPNPLGYDGAYLNTSGLYTMGDRTYDPTIARFTQPDPKGQGPDPYAYAGDNPVNNTDPTGTSFLNISISGCLGICVDLGVDIGADGVNGTAGLGVGPDAGVDASATENSGEAEDGVDGELECTAGGAVVGAGTGGGVEAGATTATEAGCEAGVVATY